MLHCNVCNAELDPKAKFCTNCGTSLESKESTGKRGRKESSGRIRYHYGKAKYAHDTLKIADRFLSSQNLVTQTVESGKEIILQGKQKPNLFKKALGLDQAVTVSLIPNNGDLKVTLGGAKWIDKAAGVGVGWFLFAPAILTTGWGIYKQQRLFNLVESEIEAFLDTKP